MATKAPGGSKVVQDPQGVEVTITDERWLHIVDGHPEMAPHRADLERTISQPLIVYGKGTDRIYFARVTSSEFGETHLQARVMPKPNHFVVTAWLMRKVDPPKGSVPIWPKPK
jgi:hypothetical protein